MTAKINIKKFLNVFKDVERDESPVKMKAIILVAGVGNRIKDITDKPKCLLEINNKPLLVRYLNALTNLNISNVVFVVGYKKEMIEDIVNNFNFTGTIKFIENPDFLKGSILSLYKAKSELNGDIILMDGDVYFDEEILNKLVMSEADNLILIDTTSSSSGEEMMVGVKNDRVIDIKRKLVGDFDIIGEAIGFYKLSSLACETLKGILEDQINKGMDDVGYEDILPFLFQRVHFKSIIVDGLKWIEIDFKEDVYRAENLSKGEFIKKRRTT